MYESQLVFITCQEMCLCGDYYSTWKPLTYCYRLGDALVTPSSPCKSRNVVVALYTVFAGSTLMGVYSLSQSIEPSSCCGTPFGVVIILYSLFSDGIAPIFRFIVIANSKHESEAGLSNRDRVRVF